MDDPKDYLDLQDAIDVPWDELRSERTLKNILEASAAPVAAPLTLPAHNRFRTSPWLMAAAAALVIGTAGLTAITLHGSGSVRADDSLAKSNEEAGDSERSGSQALMPDASERIFGDEAKNDGETGSLLDDPDAGSLLAFADGAHARLGANASVRVLVDSSIEIRVGQEEGEVVYEITEEAKKGREIVVEVAHLFIMVQGSQFSATLTDNKVSIEVIEGVIIIDDGRKQLELVEGDSLRLERQTRSEKSGSFSTSGRRVKSVRADGKRNAGKKASVDELMNRADEARRNGDLAASAAALHQLVRGEAQGKAPPLTWMTLGRVERRRGNHQAAARAFESYWKRHSNRPLAEDALHQAFMSRRAAGQAGEAARIAKIYLDAFPAGLHAAQMAPYGP